MADSKDALASIVSNPAIRNFETSSHLEWLDTNHTGAFAMGTAAGVNTRRYHGLLIATEHPPSDRMAILARTEETIAWNGREFELATAQYPGVVQPAGYELLQEFRAAPMPTWRYDLGGLIIEKTICLIDGEQSVLIGYRASQDCKARVRLMIAARDYHSLAHQNGSLQQEVWRGDDRFAIAPYQGVPTLTFRHSAATLEADAKWYLNNEYLRELDRGLDFREDLYSPGSIAFDLKKDEQAWILTSAEKDAWDRALDDRTVEATFAEELSRRQFPDPLFRALDQFRIKREGGAPSLIAGYPWFTDWSRDTLISLPALSRAGFPAAETKAILEMLLGQRRQGMLPNRFCDQAGDLEYNNVDGTLWFFVAAQDYLDRSKDREFLVQTIYPAAIDILDWHNKGTAYNIKNDPADNLLSEGAEGVQLTWMDAKVGDNVITPRRGKPVEINALWYNALKIAAGWATTVGATADARKFGDQAQATLDSFRGKFWNEQSGCLFDVVDAKGNDASIRPNQIFSLSLPFPLLAGAQAQLVAKAVGALLLTPVGVRTLAPSAAGYRGRYEGDMASRDSAYHQGTAWPWLIGPYITGYLHAFGKGAAQIAYCRRLLEDLETQWNACCLGSLSEVYDGDPPQRPSGCPAQLWSVAQIILARDAIAAAQ